MMRILLLLFSAIAVYSQSAGVGQIWTFLTPTTLQSAATANGNGTNMGVGGLSSVIFSVNCSVTCSGGTTINFEASDNTTNWTSISAVNIGTGTIATSIANQSSATITFWQTPIGGFQTVRARISGYSAGTVTVTATASAADFAPKWLNANLSFAGTAADTNSGNKSAATQRMVIATDQPNLTTPLNENVAQINGVTPLMGNGTTGTGSQRVTIASDNTAFSVNSTLGAETTKVIGTVRVVGNVGAAHDAATGAAPPANAILIGGLTSGATGGFMTAIPVCDSTALLDMTTATTTEIVALVSGRTVRICSISVLSNGTAVVTIKRGTGTNCGTGTTSISPAWDLTAQTGLAIGGGLGMVLQGTSGNAICVTSSAAVNVHALVSYAIY